jgi:hypothetical protein
MRKLIFALITADSSYSFKVIAVSSVETAVTFMSAVRGRMQVDDVITVNGTLSATTILVRARAERIILLADTPNGSALIRIISGGGVPQEVQAAPEARVVADVVP